MSIIKTIIQAANELEETKITNYDHIKPKAIDRFLNMLTIPKIKELSNKFKPIEIQGKVTHKKFINLMNEIFEDTYMYHPLYELIFKRFKLMKCSILSNKEKTFITKIISEEEISAYEICCALTIFIKCEFKDKVKLLFELTDIDEDGFLNEEEIIRLITTLNFLFCHEEKPISVGSTIINQSLANIRVKESLDMLMYTPGELKKVLNSEIYIDFETFFERLTRIPFYKFKIIPCFVNFKDCLNVDKQEKGIAVNRKLRDDFVKVSNDILTTVKLSPNKNEELKFKYPSRKIPNKEILTTNNNEKLNNKKLIIKTNQKTISTLNTNATTIHTSPNSNTIPNDDTTRRKSNAVFKFKSTMKNLISKGIQDRNGITCNYSKIRNMEIYPALIKIIDDKKTITDSNLQYESGYAQKYKHVKNTDTYKDILKKHNRYLTKTEILSEIEGMSNRHRGEEFNEKIMKDVKLDVAEEAAKMRNYLKEKNKSDNHLIFGKYKDIKISI